VPTVSRELLHRAVDKLPEDRLGAAAELLEALARHDERVAAWRASLNGAEVSEIARSLAEEHAPGDWIPDEAVEAWMNSEDNVLAACLSEAGIAVFGSAH
jgi:anti-sigma factor RsiW